MVNFLFAQKAFKEYLKNYDINEGMNKLKIKHTYGVVSLSEYIANDLKLDRENIELAKLIALLHDVARFEQAKEFGNYCDYKNVDHAELAVKILFGDEKIRDFIVSDSYDNIILKSIRNHNKLKIEEGLSDIELLHAKIIRDADKTDNFRVKANDRFEDIFNSSLQILENDIISDNIYNDFMNEKIIISNERKTDMDCWVSYIAFIFDYNFISGLKYIKENDYINKLVDRIDYKNKDTKMKMEEIRRKATNYINNKLM